MALYTASFDEVLSAQKEVSRFHETLDSILHKTNDYLERFDASIAAGEKLFEKPDNPVYDKMFEELKRIRQLSEGSIEDRRHARKMLDIISKNLKDFKDELTDEEIQYFEKQIENLNGYFSTFNNNFVNFGDKIISVAENAWFAATNLLGNNPLVSFAGKFVMDFVKKKYEEKKRIKEEKERIRRETNIERHLRNIEKVIVSSDRNKFASIEKERERIVSPRTRIQKEKEKRKGRMLDGIISMLSGVLLRFGGIGSGISAAISSLFLLPKAISRVVSSITSIVGKLFSIKGISIAARTGSLLATRALPLVGAGMLGWEVGKFIDEKTGIGNAIGNMVWNVFGKREVEKRNQEILQKRQEIARKHGFSSWEELVKHNREIAKMKENAIQRSLQTNQKTTRIMQMTKEKASIFADQIQVFAQSAIPAGQVQQPIIINAPQAVQTQQTIMLPSSPYNNRLDKNKHKI